MGSREHDEDRPQAGYFTEADGSKQLFHKQISNTDRKNEDRGVNLQQESVSVNPQVPRNLKKSTVSNYKKICKSLINYTNRKDKIESRSGKINLKRIVKDLFDRDLSFDTKKTYAAALIFWFTRNQNKIDFVEALHYLHACRRQLSKKGSKTSRKRHFIRDKDYQLLIAYLEKWSLSSKWACRCLVAVRATLASGLRPSEWETAKWANATKTKLYVVNAKTKQSPPAYSKMSQAEWDEMKIVDRIIPVSCETGRAHIDAQLQSLQDFKISTGKGIDQFKHGLRDALRDACLKIWGESKYTLRDLRGQFAANARFLYGAKSASEMMGHSGPNTPSRGRYGLKNQASSAIKGERLVSRDDPQDHHGDEDHESGPRPGDG